MFNNPMVSCGLVTEQWSKSARVKANKENIRIGMKAILFFFKDEGIPIPCDTGSGLKPGLFCLRVLALPEPQRAQKEHAC